MANLKEIRIRISSVESTKQITSAMKLVAASKLRKAQDSIEKMRPYASKLQEILGGLSSGSDVVKENDFSIERDPENILIIAVASNRGLCGAFNSNVNKKVIQLITEEYASQNAKGNVQIMTIGKKATEFFKKGNYNIHSSHDEIWTNLEWDNVVPVVNSVLDEFSSRNFDKVEIVYNRFKNAATQILSHEQFLPIVPDQEEEDSKNTDYILEPSKEVIVNELIPKSLRTLFYKSLLDSFASEHGARMTAMHKATDNATELVKELKLSYNKARQAAITNEIIEIVGGANAL